MAIGHDSKMAGHLRIAKTSDRIKANFYWPGMTEDVRRYCKSCDVCQRTIHKGSLAPAPLGKMPLIDVPFKRVAIDLIGPINPKSSSGFRYILTLVDYATRYPEAVSLRNCTAKDVANALVSIFSRLGVPEEILTDQGRQFTSQYMKEVINLLEISHLMITPYHPMCNGLVESFNGTLKQMLRRMCDEQPKKWDQFIDPLLFAYREVRQSSTGFSPFELLCGRTVRGPLYILKELWTGQNEAEVQNSYQYVIRLKEKLESTMKLAQKKLEKAQDRYKHHYDKKSKKKNIKVCDKVLVLFPTHRKKLMIRKLRVKQPNFPH